MYRIFPFTFLSVALYNILVFALGLDMSREVFGLTLPSDAYWSVTTGDALLAGSVAFLFVEMLSATSSRATSVINHGLSMVVFILCIVEFLLVPACGTSLFFLITMMVLLDVVAGYSITIMTARRDLAVGDMHH